MLHRLHLPALLCLVAACSDPPATDAGTTSPDAGMNANADAAPNADATAYADAARNGDAEPNADAAPNADASASNPCNAPFQLDGVNFGSMLPTRTLLPVAPAPTDVTRIDETETAVYGALTRMSAAGVAWHTQVSHLTMFDLINYEHLLLDPVSGAVYAGIEQQMQQDGTALRFYGNDRVLARELVRDGTPGMDMVGASRQSNFFVVKYSPQGAVEWVSRFGPNRPNTDRAGTFAALGLTATGLRVVGAVEGSTEIVLAPGTPSALTFQATDAMAFWGELSPQDGSYVAGSVRRIDANNSGRTTLNALAYAAHNGSGETALGGALIQTSGSTTFTVGAGGAAPRTVTATRSFAFVTKIGASGEPAFLATASVPAFRNAIPEMRAVGISPAGEVVAGGQFPGSGTEARFTDGAGASAMLGYQAQQSFLAAYEPGGALCWLKLIVATHRNAISRIVVTGDTVYVMHTLAMGDVLGRGEAGETVLPVSGYHLGAFSLATGELRWVRSFTDRTGMSSPAAYDVWISGANLVVPTGFPGGGVARVVGGGSDQSFEPLGQGFLGAFLFSTQGTLLECQAIALNGGGRFRVLP